MLFRPIPLVVLGLIVLGGLIAPAQATQLSAVAAPTLKWQYGGCNAPPHYCDTGWYASPAVADLDGDAKPEVIWASYDLFTLNGENGSVQWTASGSARACGAVDAGDVARTVDVADGAGEDRLGRAKGEAIAETADAEGISVAMEGQRAAATGPADDEAGSHRGVCRPRRLLAHSVNLTTLR